MVKMISKGGHRYRNKAMTAGEEFDVDSQSQRRLMKAMKWADDAPEKVEPAPPAPVVRAYTRRNVEADAPASPPAEGLVAGKTTRRTYQRRDLTAEKSDD